VQRRTTSIGYNHHDKVGNILNLIGNVLAGQGEFDVGNGEKAYRKRGIFGHYTGFPRIYLAGDIRSILRTKALLAGEIGFLVSRPCWVGASRPCSGPVSLLGAGSGFHPLPPRRVHRRVVFIRLGFIIIIKLA
jgi:hypothetical protein